MALQIPHNSLSTREKEKLDGDLSGICLTVFVPSGIFEQKQTNVNKEYKR